MDTTGVAVVKEFTVLPANEPATGERTELTPFDLSLILLGPIQKGLLFRKPTISNRHSTAAIVDQLRGSLSRTLDFFPPLAGRLVATSYEDGTTSFSIHSNGSGVLFMHANALGVSVPDIVNSNTPPILRSFFPLNGARNHEGTYKPLLAVQVTELADGLFIGITLNHSVADGTSFWHFVNCWSEISRGNESPTLLPVFSRDILGDLSRTFRFLFPTKDWAPSPESEYPVRLIDKVFHFGAEKIAVLKKKAREENGGTQISSLQALLCHLWRAVLRSRGTDGDGDTTYTLVVGTRSRTRPPLPIEYFGNGMLMVKMETKIEELIKGGLGHGSRLMHGAVVGVSSEVIMGFLEKWEETPRMDTIENMASGSLLTGSSPRFDVYGNDFGWGKPMAVRSGGANKFDGKLTVYPGEETGGIDVEASLLVETLEAMEKDAEFMEVVNP